MDMRELPLVFFTLFTQTAVGLVLLAAVRSWVVAEGPDPRVRVEWSVVLGLLAVGVVAAFFHLGQPLGVFRMVSNLGAAWLSREILLFAAFGVVAAAAAAAAYRGSPRRWLVQVAAALGLLALVATGMTYAAPGMPALHNGIPLVSFGLTAVILGAAVGTYFAPEEMQRRLASIVSHALVAALLVYLVVPFVWLGGDAVMRATGQAFLSSPLYWAHVVLGLGLPLGVVWRTQRIPAWLPVLLVLGELAGRVVFFGLVATSAGNIGLPY
ncbi:MAG: dimethyl sulfoxide reductase anchor subunit [Actinobacteria bacterium]|nr:dimethyl sulfoxide reductase anchor subunit [Actinomycetota bacterium]